MTEEANAKKVIKNNVAQTILSGPILNNRALPQYVLEGKLKLFNINAPMEATHRNLPHWVQEGTTYWVTFRLADSIPATKLAQWNKDRDQWVSYNPEPWDDEKWVEYEKLFGQCLDKWLDAGQGECSLRRHGVRATVENCLMHFDGKRYDLPAWVIMPNHVHALLRPFDGFEFHTIMQGIKGVSARECNKLLKRTGEIFWQDESYDHIVRSLAQFKHFLRYIAENPKKAKLGVGEYTLM